MSVLGTGVAAGVAQAGLQAREVAGRRDRQKAQADADAQRMREMAELHARTVEEGDRPGETGLARVDGPAPEQGGQQTAPGPEDRQERDAPQQQTTAPEQGAEEPAAAPDAPDNGLYRHLDIQA